MKQELTEKEIYDAFGLSQDDAGGKEQEVADPVPEETEVKDETDQDEQEPEPETTEEAETQDAEEHAEEGQDEELLTQEQRKDLAGQRRRREQQSAIDAAVDLAVRQAVERVRAEEKARFDTEMTSFFASAELTDTVTGNPITNMREFKSWKEAFDRGKIESELRDGQLTPETLNTVISQHPAVKRSEELNRIQDEQLRLRDLEESERRAQADLDEIRKLDPAVGSLQDILDQENGRQFYEYVTKNKLRFLDAYRLVNQDKLAQAQARAARQKALNNQRSKDHLSQTEQRGAGAQHISVPEEEMALFKTMMPKATEADIQKYYQRYLNE